MLNRNKMSHKVICSVVLFACATAALAFTWQTCGEDSDPIKIMTLTGFLNSSDILFVSGRVKVAFNLTPPISVEVKMSKKFFWGWTILPCVDEFGSCNYTNICELIPYNSGNCPDDFVKNQIPCTCPVPQGQYTAKTFPIDLNILPKWLEKGTYRVQVSVKKNDNRLLCIVVTQTI